MSGIVALLQLDGAPVDETLLRRMTGFLTFRGPDAQDVWLQGSVGFGHTMLRTTREAAREHQPCSLDGKVWITADARVDGRADLIRELKARGRDVSEITTDVELILHAYHAWDNDCVRHLIGDFAFAIWDDRRSRLFCARDHFGVKPLYFTQVGQNLIVSNTLNCLRLHPAVSDRLNDLAIADFLLFGCNQEPETTTFADIQRVPPAHTLIWTKGDRAAQRSRYWKLPIDGCIRFKRTEEYVEQYQALFRQAVEDRLRADSVSVFMSGGLDSTAIAAVAKDLQKKSGNPCDLQAHTVVYDELIPDQERHFATIAAQEIGLPIHFLVADGYKLFEGQESGQYRTPEPFNEPLSALTADLYRAVALTSRIALWGYGGDPLHFGHRLYFMRLLRQWKWVRFGVEIVRYQKEIGRRPSLGLRGLRMRRKHRTDSQLSFPTHLNEDLISRYNLRDRWQHGGWKPELAHPLRSEAYEDIVSPVWTQAFERRDPGTIHALVEERYPFFDIRFVEYLLALPPTYLLVDKGILRMAMHGVLPETIRCRGKLALGVVGDPIGERLRRGEDQILTTMLADDRLADYVNRPQLGPLNLTYASYSKWLSAMSLNLWLLSQDRSPLQKGHK